ncbi:MAG: hypothetical protein JW969_05885 [Spirochaetales bacterium]|nr:hypothetical protein [Spirochaetales bacterium]
MKKRKDKVISKKEAIKAYYSYQAWTAIYNAILKLFREFFRFISSFFSSFV